MQHQGLTGSLSENLPAIDMGSKSAVTAFTLNTANGFSNSNLFICFFCFRELVFNCSYFATACSISLQVLSTQRVAVVVH